MKLFMAGLCVLFMAGCSSVTMKEPFPESQLTEEEQGLLEGVWRIEGGIVHIALTSNGIPWLAMVEWEDDDFQMEKFRMHFTKHDGALYVSIPSEADGKEGGYLFAEFKQDGNQAFAWIPDEDFFAELVKNGQLKGTVEESKHSKSIALDNDAVEILELICTNHAAIDYKNPLLFQKLD